MDWRASLPLFRHRYEVKLRYSDIDMLGHVNNARYLTFLEDARVTYMKDVMGWDGRPQSLGIILARTEVDFRIPVFLTDRIWIFSRICRLGTKSFDMEYLTLKCAEDGTPTELAAFCKAVQVTYDVAAEASIAIPAEFAAAARTYEPGLA